MVNQIKNQPSTADEQIMLQTKDERQENTTTGTVRLKKEIGVFNGIAIIVGVIVGSGIFVSPVGVLKYTKSVGLSFVMWTVTAIYSIIGSLIYAELGVTIQRSGGEYIYILETFGGLASFITLWITFTIIGAASLAANSLIFADYVLRSFYPTCATPPLQMFIVAIAGITLLGAINSQKVTWGTKFAVVSTICKIFAMCLIIGFGIYYLSRGNIDSFIDSFDGSDASPGALSLAFYQGFWAFGGWNYLNFVIGEMKNPARNVPIVIFTSLMLVTVVYMLTNIAYLAVISPAEMLALSEKSAAVAMVFAARCMGMFQYAMPVFIGLSVLGSMNGEIIAMSRLAYTAGEEGHLPAILSMLNINNLTPVPAIMLLVILSLLFLTYRDLFYLIGLSGFAFSVMSEMSVLSLVYLRRYRPQLNKTGFKLPIFFPILYLIVNGCIGAMSVYQEPSQSLLSIILMAAAIPIYIAGVMLKRNATVQQKMGRLNRTLQKTFNVVPEVKDDEDTSAGSNTRLRTPKGVKEEDSSSQI